MQKGYVESFNGKFRDECLNEKWFTSLTEARRIIEQWRRHYNEERPHSGLDYLTPAAFAAKRRGAALRSPTARSMAAVVTHRVRLQLAEFTRRSLRGGSLQPAARRIWFTCREGLIPVASPPPFSLRDSVLSATLP